LENQYIYLDIGDTVLHLRQSPGEIYLDLINSFGMDISGIESIKANEAFYKAWKYLDNKFQKPDYRDRYSFHPKGSIGFWNDLIAFFLNSLHLPNHDSLRKYIFESFETGEHWEIEPSFFELVHLAQENEIKMGVLSNWDNRLRNLLKKKEIYDYFDDFIISGEIGFEKPSSEIFMAAEKRIGRSGDSILYAGDKLSLDWIPASERGWKAFLFLSEWKNQPAQNNFTKAENLPKGCDIINKLDTILGKHMNSIDAKAP